MIPVVSQCLINLVGADDGGASWKETSEKAILSDMVPSKNSDSKSEAGDSGDALAPTPQRALQVLSELKAHVLTKGLWGSYYLLSERAQEKGEQRNFTQEDGGDNIVFQISSSMGASLTQLFSLHIFYESFWGC